ncbi:cript family protein [Pyricularia oryzae]|uniref:Uncharacterized protein n=1 Tax=Pyricularia oryzae TaxID=318829 RepID=A0A4P7N9U6_PYROR|nr:cript family protein [Pyricularia oryzae]KAI7930672.1 cript family protein [Pyricularia oryzae]QBZ59547.1 hypothetical protein PoMZ_04508 [Pyricularia oryzae]
MVCGKCQKLSKGTSLATPSVKKKSEMYYGSPASSSASKSSATLGQTGVSKNKLLSKGAKNPYAQYSSIASVLVTSAKPKSHRVTNTVIPAHIKQMLAQCAESQTQNRRPVPFRSSQGRSSRPNETG